MADSFNMGEPQRLAMAVGGKKEVLAQGASSGTINPTLAVLAGMYIDYMQKAQAMGTGQQPTVAQQVLGGQPPAPPAPPPPPAGLGATPQATAMPPMGAPPEMGMAPPQEMPQPEMGMAAGGLTSLPVPDAMFDEPDNGGFNDGYAGGGMVAFADGGTAGGGFGDYIEQMVRKLDPNIQIAGRARTPSRNAEVGGVPNSYHVIDAARDVSVPPGMSKAAFIAQLKGTLGADYDVLPSKGNSVHIEPGPRLGEKVRAGARPSGIPSILPDRDTKTAEGRAMSAEDSIALAQRQLNKLPREAIERAKKASLEELDPAYIEKQKKLNEAEAITAAGLELMAPEDYKGENIFGSIAKAMKTGLSAYGAGKKEQKAAKNAAVRELMAYEELDRKTAVAAIELGFDAYKVGMSADQANRALAFDEKKLAAQLSDNEKDRQVTMAAAMYRSQNPSDFDTKFAMYKKSYPGFSEVAILKQMKTDGLLGSSQAGMEAMPGVTPQTGGAEGQQPVLLGSRPVQ